MCQLVLSWLKLFYQAWDRSFRSAIVTLGSYSWPCVFSSRCQDNNSNNKTNNSNNTSPRPNLSPSPNPSPSPLWKTRLHYPERLTLPSLMHLLVLLAQSRVPPQLDLFLAILMLLLAEIKLPVLPQPLPLPLQLWLTKQDLPTALKKLCFVYPPCIRILPGR